MSAIKNVIILIVVTVAVTAAIVFGLSYLLDVKPSLTAEEKKFARFRHEGIKIIERKPAMMSGLKSPVQFKGLQEKDYPPALLAEIAPVADDKASARGGKNGDKEKEKRKQRVSLVFIKDHARFAIVDGLVVKEGDMTKNGRIKMIKKEGILVKDNEGDKWLRIE